MLAWHACLLSQMYPWMHGMDVPIVEEHPHEPCDPGLRCPSKVSNRKGYTTQGYVPNPFTRDGVAEAVRRSRCAA
jgi:hypothetical protein